MILVVGVNGMLGNAVAKVGKKVSDVVGTYHKFHCEDNYNDFQLDITDKERVEELIKKVKPDIVINCVAFQPVDLCEEKPALARSIHVDGTKNLSNACAAAGAKFVHISTDFVFDGEKSFYSEADKPNPINVYGLTKLDGERVLSPEDLLIRTSIFGINVEDKKSMIEWIVSDVKAGKEIHILEDSFFTPIYTGHLAEIIFSLYEKGQKGLLHVAGGERVSKYDFALNVADVYNLDKTLIKKIKLEDFKRAAPRPRDTSLNCDKVKKLGIELFPAKKEIEMMKNES